MREDLYKKTPEQLQAMLADIKAQPYQPQPKGPVAGAEYQRWRKAREERSARLEAIEVALASKGIPSEGRFPDLPAPQRRLTR